MNYVGLRVRHNYGYGEGTITSQDSKGRITVKFDTQKSEKKFTVPSCFQEFLQLLDTNAASVAEKEIVLFEEEKKIEKENRRKEARERALYHVAPPRHKTGTSSIDISIPLYSSVNDFCVGQQRAINDEVSYIRTNGGKRIKLHDGVLVETKSNSFIYSFDSETELSFPDNTQILLWASSSATDSLPATILNSEDFTVVISSSRYLGKDISVIEFSAEPWRLLSYLIDRLEALKEKPSPIVEAIICDGRRRSLLSNTISKGQDEACKMSLSQPITFVWGPPGTGKTETLAKIALQHLELGHRVLMLSYSNVSVDGAIWRVFNKDHKNKPGRLVRYGYPRDKELLQHEYLTSYNLVLLNHPDLLQKRSKLQEERRKLSRTSPRYIEISQQLTKIKDQLDEEEKRALNKASFVATTVSKAIADKTLYGDKYDTVIFDEASMAYIPQIVFSAGLAKKHFICMGDFAQLPPIVQNSNTSILNVDIFKYCGIVEAIESGKGHKWLCMLDKQFRMYPEIATFSSNTMYKGLLKSGPNMEEQRKSIVWDMPYRGEALKLVDLSGMMSVCIKTADQSRINVLSAFIAMNIAISAARKHEVGIITPYNAQSRLLHSMSRDVMERSPDLKTIACATVHQFQGSEKDVIVYDAVDCYRMQYPGSLLTTTANNYSNRLYNVAVTRAKGKFISIANVDYMITKGFSKSLIFRSMMDSLMTRKKTVSGTEVIISSYSDVLKSFSASDSERKFIQDIDNAHKEIISDIPGGTDGSSVWFSRLAIALKEAQKRGVRVCLRTDERSLLPKEIRGFAIENRFVSNPITLIDKETVWYGMPFSKDDFVAEGKTIPTRFRPIFRYKGSRFAKALYSFLNMNQRIDAPAKNSTKEVINQGPYHSFASYVAGEIKCRECGGKMSLKKSKRGKFFLACSNYPKCENTQLVEVKIVQDYFYFKNRIGKRCPRDNTSLEAKMGPYGLYVCCCALERHKYKLDEI